MARDNFEFLRSLSKSHHEGKSQLLYYGYLKGVKGTRPFRPFDYCARYSLIASSNRVVKGCLNSEALFTVVDQRVSYDNCGPSGNNTLRVEVRCDYVDTEGSNSAYLFTVLLNYNRAPLEYVYGISVNLNGTALLLCSTTSCFVVSTPYELAKYTLLDGWYGCNISLSEPLVGQQIKNPDHSQVGSQVVMAVWNPLYSNSFAVVCNNTPNPVGYDTLTNGHSLEHYSSIRVFNLDESIDEPLYEFVITERMCRLGLKGRLENHKFQPEMGVLVDVFWSSDESSPLGPFAIFVLSNYGFLFCYCPVFVSQIHDFNTSLALVRKYLSLVSDGFSFNFDEMEEAYMDGLSRVNAGSELERYISSIQSTQFSMSPYREFYPIVIKLVSDNSIPDCTEVYSYPNFSSLTVLASDPLTLVCSTSDSSLYLFETGIGLCPGNSDFFSDSLVNKTHFCRQTQTLKMPKELPYSLLGLSKSSFLCFSKTRCYRVSTNKTLEASLVYVADEADPGSLFYSAPLVVAPSSVDSAFPNFGLASPAVFVLNFKDGSSSNLPLFFLYDLDNSCDASGLEGLTLSKPDGLSLGSAAHDQLVVLKHDADLFERFYNSKKEVNGYKEILKSIKRSTSETDLNKKAVDAIKQVGRLHSEVVGNLDAAYVYRDAVAEYVRRGEKASLMLDNFYNDTIELYHAAFQGINLRVDRARRTSELIARRRAEVLRMLAVYNASKDVDATMEYVSNMISEFYLRFSRVILKSAEDSVRSAQYSATYDSRKQLMIDEWFYETLKENVGIMHRIFARIRTMRTAIDTMY